MMFRSNSKITDKFLICFVSLLLINVYSYAETFTQSVSIENEQSTNQPQASVKSSYDNTILHTEEKKEKQEPKNDLVIYDSMFSNPYAYPPYNREIIYRVVPAYQRSINVGGYSYKGYAYNYKGNAYNFNGGYYYGNNGKKHVTTLMTPVPDPNLYNQNSNMPQQQNHTQNETNK